jgi:bifunctional DNA primase/polymerase-like protein/AAA domain-containing protein/primase-like protein
MGMLAAALAWAARGFRVFPLVEGSKLPVDIGWTTAATTDPEIIRRWWTDPVLGVERNYNVGFLTNEWIVPDVDVKEGKHGLETMAEVGLEFDTLTVVTPSGGYHLVYSNDGAPVGQSPLGPGIDIRSHNGYVVAPGSRLVNGGEYRVIIDLPVTPFPAHLRSHLAAPRKRPERQPEAVIDLDQPEFIEIAAHWLRTAAPKAVEGLNGDDTTYRVSCRLRDYGLSAETAFSLLEEIWNQNCDPPWEADELRKKVSNAYEYATGVAGSSTAQAAFEGITALEPPAATFRHGPNGTPYHFGNLLAVGEIETRPWVLGTLLLNRTVTAIIAGGGAGKSLLNLIIAAHLAVGKDFLGHKCFRAGKSIVFDAEDDVAEQSRRLHAICTVYGFDIEVVRKNVCLVSGSEIMLQLTMQGQGGPVINKQHIDELVATLRDPETVMLALGPLAELHSSNENDNIAMRYVMGVLRIVATEGDVAVLVAHHTAKPPIASSEAWVGSQYAGRGASAVPFATRHTVTMFAASAEDCLELGVPSKDRSKFVRLDTGKINYAKAGETQWLRWQDVRLWNGDEVGVLAPHDAKDSFGSAARMLARDLISVVRQSGSATLGLEQTLGVLMRDPLIAKEGKATARNRLERMLTEPVQIDGTELALIRGIKGVEGVAIR